MLGKIEIFNMAQGLAEHAAARQTIVARNVANADTPGYRQKDLAGFSEVYASSNGTEPLQPRVSREGHLNFADSHAKYRSETVQDAIVSPNGNSVSIENEVLKAAEIRQQHDLALSVYRSGLSVVRASLGRG